MKKTKMNIKKNLASLLFIGLASTQLTVTAQTSESCNCVVDTAGLENYLSSISLQENNPLQFSVPSTASTFAVLHGVIGNTTPAVVNAFINDYPNVTTLVFMQMPGSEDDESNLIAATALHNRGYKHYLPGVNKYPQDAFIASGAVDMFTGGTIRVVDNTGEVGVHSWSDGSNDATAFPVGHANHLPYIEYYVDMGFSQQLAEDFYYYTINAAVASSIYLMPDADIDLYHIRSCRYAATPVYTASNTNGVLAANLDNVNYQWIDCNDNNTPISGATNQSYTPLVTGSYAVQITETGCSGTTECMTIAENNLENATVEERLIIYPNPAKGNVTITTPNNEEIQCYELYALSGELLLKKNCENYTITELKLELGQGVYIIKVYLDDKDYSKKLFIN